MEEKKNTQGVAPKSPSLAAILALIPGVGAIYNGQIFKALMYILIFGGLILMQEKSGAQPIPAFLLTGFYIFMIFEAYRTAKAINKKAIYGEVEEEFEEVEMKGSIFWGLFLIFLGIVFILGNYNVVPYSTLVEYWPVLLIIIGIKLIIDYYGKKHLKRRNNE